MREMQIKPIVRFHLTRMAGTAKTNMCRNWNPHTLLVGCKTEQPPWKTVWQLPQS